jgi:hypothetical protein
MLVLAGSMAPVGSAASPSMLQLTDDRGKAVAGSLRVCFQLERSLDCRQIEHGEAIQAPAAFVEVTAEGEDYGPVKIRREAIPAASGGALRLAVARKALLVIKRAGAPQPAQPGSSGRASEALSVSLYRPEDMTFREPAFRALLAAGETTIKVPAGDFIAALSGGAKAPDLHRLAVMPAAMARLNYEPRPGWSLVVRCRAEGNGKAVRDTEVKIAEDPRIRQAGGAHRQRLDRRRRAGANLGYDSQPS